MINKTYFKLEIGFSFSFAKNKKKTKEKGKNNPIIRVDVAIAANSENNKIFLIFFFSNILKAKYIEKTTKDKNIISLLL